MVPIKSLLSKFLKRKEIKQQLEEVKVCEVANQILKEAFNTDQVKATFFKNSILQIKCTNSVLSNEVQLRKQRIKNLVNEELKEPIVKDIFTKIQ